MSRRWTVVPGVLLAVLLGACGGKAGEPSASAASGASSNAGEGGAADAAAAGSVDGTAAAGATSSTGASSSGGTSSSSGASSSGKAGASAVAGAGSAVGSAHAPVDCEHTTPLQQGGGYEQCTQGLLRRPSAAACRSSLPRAKPDTPLVHADCQADGDCVASAHGFCAYGACEYGCVSDSECPADQACFCGTDIGACVPANCHSDADCAPNSPCVAYLEPGFALPEILACEAPSDECLTTSQCNSLNPRVSCKFQVDHRVCYQDLVG